MVLKQRNYHQRVPSPRSRINPRSSSLSSVGSTMSLPMGDGRISPRSNSLLQQSSGSNGGGSLLKRRSMSAYGKLKMESPILLRKSLRDSTSSSAAGGGEVSPEKKRQLSPTFFEQSPQSAESSPRRAFFGSSSGSLGSSHRQPSSAFGNTDYLRNDLASASGPAAAWRARIRTFALAVLAVLLGGKFYRSALAELAERESQLAQLRNDFHILHGKIRSTEDALKSAQKSNTDLELRAAKMRRDESRLMEQLEEARKANEMGEELLGPGKIMSGLDKEEANELILRRQKAMRHRIELLQKQIQTISRREAEERFGPGPHRVVFTVLTEHVVETDGGKTKVRKEEPASFTVQLAPLSQMPHSVHLFLQMVAHRLWDDTIFLHTAHHVLQAAPLSYPSGSSKREQFDAAELAHLSFQEYSDEYPHDKYTIGFGGRPGGPDFFINTQDNDDYHGPGGQDHHDLHEEADPCFGKVISGTAVVDRLHRRSVAMVGTGGEGWDGDNIPITTIVSVRLEGEEKEGKQK